MRKGRHDRAGSFVVGIINRFRGANRRAASAPTQPKEQDISLLKENLVRNTTCSEQIVYSAIETTCFGLYWPPSGFYNIEGESINAVKTMRGFVD